MAERRQHNRRRILIDVCHPAEVHHFKHLYWELSKQGWSFLFVAKDKDVTAGLLAAYNLPHVMFSKSRRGIVRKILSIPNDLLRFYRIVRQFRPTFLFSNLSLHASWIAAIYPVVHIAFIDTEHRRLLDYLTLPFAQVKLTPRAYGRHLGRVHFRYAGNHEMAYCHPQRFAAQADIRNMLGLEPKESFVLLRFVAWSAFHDVGLLGISFVLKRQLVDEIEKDRRVFISSESPLPPEFQKYQLNVPPDRIHDVLYCADAYIGEGGTMASEAVCLGTPAVYINTLPLGYCREEADAGLLVQYQSITSSDIQAIAHTFKTKSFQERHRQFVDSCEDVTAYMAQFVKGYPASLKSRGNRLF